MKISENLSLGRFMTFQESKRKPFHRWFYYKEGYAPEIVEYAVRSEGLNGRDARLLDPFCGAGTSLLAAKHLGMRGFGVDASELAVFVSKTKCANYSQDDISEIKSFFEVLQKLRRPSIRWVFELFDIRAAFPKRNLDDILAIRQAIAEADCGEKAKNFLLLALISVLPQTSIIVKDGGVLKIDRRKRAMPAKEAFKRKLKQMLGDIEKSPPAGFEPVVSIGDARRLEFENASFDIIVTSPPYLNNVDYSKIYGLELTLLALDAGATKELRTRLLRSFIKREHEGVCVPPECGDIGRRIPIVAGYFADMEKAMEEMKRVLRAEGASYIVVSNSVIFSQHIPVDEILGRISERLGMEAEITVGARRIADVRPQRVQTRESVVILRKR